MSKEKLSQDAWIAAGFRTLSTDGPAAIQIKVLATKLGATKGSFYWHFADLAAFKSAMLDLWRSKVASDVIVQVMAEPNPRLRLDILFANAIIPPPDEYGGQKTEPAMRAWALSDPIIAEALEQVDTIRRQFLETIFEGLGIGGTPLVDLTYAAYIGLDDLGSKGRADMAAALDALRTLIDLRLETKSK